MSSRFIKFKIVRVQSIIFLILLTYSYLAIPKSANQEVNPIKYHKLQVNILITPATANAVPANLHQIITDNLLICQATKEKKLTKNRIDNLYELTNKELLEILQTMGYYHATVSDNNLIMQSDNTWSVTYRITTGRPTMISAAKLNIVQDIPATTRSALEKLFHTRFKINTQLNHQQYEGTKQLILSHLKEHGFLAAEIKDAKILINLSNYTTEIRIDVDPKARYYLGKVYFKSDVYDSNFLAKYIPFAEKDLYSSNKLMQLKNNLLNSELFKKVRIDLADYRTVSGNTLPITARVYAKPANRSFASIGFGSDSGFRGKVGFVHNFYNKPGHALDLSLAITKPRKKAILDYEFLGNNVLATKYNCGLIVKQDNVRNHFSKNFESYWKKTFTANSKQHIWQVSFLHENYRELPQTKINHAHLVIPRIQFNWFKRFYTNNQNDLDLADQLQPQDQNMVLGNKCSISLKGSLKGGLSSVSMLQTTIITTYARKIFDNYRVIIKAKLGTTLIRDLAKLPLSLRFFAGGDYSVRGFGYNSLGVTARAPNGEYGIIGGKHLLLASLQLERNIPKYPDLAIAGFIDAGNATNNFNKFLKNQVALGAGTGLLYYTPIGSINFYLAKPIKLPQSSYPYKKHLRIHLTFVADL